MLRPTPEFVNQNYPIVAVRHYRNGMQIMRSGGVKIERSRGRRKHIEQLSEKSLCKLAFTAQNLSVQLTSMLCLTCGVIYPRDGLVFKRAMNRTLSAMRARYRPFEYLWFLEFQKRGAPHIHILTNISGPNDTDRQWLAERWADSLISHSLLLRSYEPDDIAMAREKLIRQHRRRRVWERVREQNGATRYVTKYATKPEQKYVPKDFARVGRFWGVSANARPKHLVTSGANEETMRIHLAGRNHISAEYNVLPELIWFQDGD